MNLFNILDATKDKAFTDLCTDPDLIPLFNLIGTAFQFLLIGIPVVLVIFGLIDLGKAVMAGEDKEIKAAQKMLMKRIIYTLLAFLLLGIVKAVIGLLGTSTDGISGCLTKIFG